MNFIVEQIYKLKNKIKKTEIELKELEEKATDLCRPLWEKEDKLKDQLNDWKREINYFIDRLLESENKI